MAKSPTPARIRLSEALVHLRPIMSRSTFYGSSTNPGPRWTHVAELDIREGPPLHMDRGKFFRWLASLGGDLARGRSSNSVRLGKAADARVQADRGGEVGREVDALCDALDRGDITVEQFRRAVRALAAPPILVKSHH